MEQQPRLRGGRDASRAAVEEGLSVIAQRNAASNARKAEQMLPHLSAAPRSGKTPHAPGSGPTKLETESPGGHGRERVGDGCLC